MTQNDLTQLADDDGISSPTPVHPSSLPWGRLIPNCPEWVSRDKANVMGGIDLLPRPPRETRTDPTASPTTILGLEGILPMDLFNEYTFGRNSHCDVSVPKPPNLSNNEPDQINEWAFAMISSKHCRLYCMLKTDSTDGNSMDVYLEDTSVNGTLVNGSTLLRRGEKRILHTGDEICLVNPMTMRKKVRSNKMLSEIHRRHAFVFINVLQQRGVDPPPLPRRLHDMLPPPRQAPARPRRRGLVDVRGIVNHSIGRLANASDSPLRKTSPPQSTTGQGKKPKQKRVEEEYDIRDVLGTGTCGEVRRAIHRRTGEERAVKVISLSGRNRTSKLTKEATAMLKSEATILQALDHPYIVKLYDVYVSPGSAIYLVMELMQGGDLFDRIVAKEKYTEVESRRVMRRLLNAVYYLHEKRNIVHRDLKPENILCLNRTDDVQVKLTDFGLAKSVTEDGLKTFCGTPQYFAPEVLRRRHTIAGRGRYGKQADMWSLGVILYILLSGSPPFDLSKGFDVVADAKVTFPPSEWGEISASAVDLVKRCLLADPSQRISVREACNHAWLLVDDGDTHTHPLEDPKAPMQTNPSPIESKNTDCDQDDGGVKEETSANVNGPMTPSDRGSPVPRNLNSRGNFFREIISRSVEKANCKKRTRVPSEGRKTDTPQNPLGTEIELSRAVTPATNNSRRDSGMIRVPQSVGANLSDDEICSQFTDDAESVSSFNTVAGRGMTSDGEGLPLARASSVSSSSSLSGKDTSSPPARPAKRRKRDIVGRVTHDDDKPAKKAEESLHSAKGNKQTKLSKWFTAKKTIDSSK